MRATPRPIEVFWESDWSLTRSNLAKFTLDGRNVTLFTQAALGMAPTARQTIRVGDVCITAVVSCHAKGKALKCAVVP